MDKFNILPTDKRFQDMDIEQINFILHSMKEDQREQDRIRRGVKLDASFEDGSFEEEVWNKDPDDWEVVKEGHNPEDIAKQVNLMTKDEDRETLIARFGGIEEYNKHLEEGGQTGRQAEVNHYIEAQLKKMDDRVKQIEYNKKHGIEEDPIITQNNATKGPDLGELDAKKLKEGIDLFRKGKKEDGPDYTDL